VLGVDPQAPRHDTVVPYVVDDLLVMYTDGLVERRLEPIADRLDRLAAVVGDHAAIEVAPLADLLLAELVTAETTDDVVLVVKRLGAMADEPLG